MPAPSLPAARRWLRAGACGLCLLAGIGPVHGAGEREVKVGSKVFTEGVLLGEIATRLLESAGIPAVHRKGLGGTQVLWNALLAGEIDVYAEYTGTLAQEILPGARDPRQVRQALAAHGVQMSRALGFNNTYAIGMREDVAQALRVESLSDLRLHPDLRLGFSNELMDRTDGWPGLRDRYRLPQQDVRGLDHDLAYRALASGAIQATDLYSTDAEVPYYRLRVLKDDLHYFPDYQAVWLYRADLAQRTPQAVAALQRLEGHIAAGEMARMNARAKLDKLPEGQVAAEFLAARMGIQSRAETEGPARQILRRTGEHLALVGISLAAAIAVAVPLGILAARRPRLGQAILAAAGVVQTIPSLALLVLMIPLLGIGAPPAVLALFLYSVLPIVRNTYTGLHDIAPGILESAAALGLPPGARLRLIELPLALRSILAGIKTSAVINVGTATLGALIGAGGYGQPILTGIRLDDTGLIMQGALPAAALALAVQGLFELLERWLVPRGLRLRAQA